eukprot:5171270-Alexandrium_andersonii.AAC.1
MLPGISWVGRASSQLLPARRWVQADQQGEGVQRLHQPGQSGACRRLAGGLGRAVRRPAEQRHHVRGVVLLCQQR